MCGGKDITRHSSSGHGNGTLVATNVTRTQTRETHCARVCGCCCISAIKTGYELEFSIKTKADKSAKLQSAKCSRCRLCATCAARHVQRAATMTNIGGYKRNGLQTLIEFAVNVIL